MENLDLTTGDVLLLTETVNDVLDGSPIDNMVSVHVHVYACGGCMSVCASLSGSVLAKLYVCMYATYCTYMCA